MCASPHPYEWTESNRCICVCLITSKKHNFIPKFILIKFMPRMNLTCCFESFWAHQKTPTWIDWTSLLLELIPYHMQESNFITQVILDMKLTHYLLSFEHVEACLTTPTLSSQLIFVAFVEPLVTSKNSTSYLNLFVRNSSLKNPLFWSTLRFLDDNSRNGFFPNMFFLKKVKRSLTLSYWSKKV